jgi:hypothetical protein
MPAGQQEADPELCWNCGQPGTSGPGGQMTCPACEVTWMTSFSAAPR